MTDGAQRVLVCSDDDAVWDRLRSAAARLPGHPVRLERVRSAEHAAKALELRRYLAWLGPWDAAVAGVHTGQAGAGACPLIAICADIESGEAALVGGASDYLIAEGLRPDGLHRGLRTAARHGDLLEHLRSCEARLRVSAFRDEVTGLWNGRQFLERLSIELQAANRRVHALTLCICTIDDLAAVTSSHGQAVADQVLTAFGEVLVGVLRPSDYVARYGADEFVIILPYTNADSALIAIRRLQHQLRERPFGGGDVTPFRITGTFGLAQAGPDATVDGVMRAADDALEDAREAGPSQVVVSTPRLLFVN